MEVLYLPAGNLLHLDNYILESILVAQFQAVSRHVDVFSFSTGDVVEDEQLIPVLFSQW